VVDKVAWGGVGEEGGDGYRWSVEGIILLGICERGVGPVGGHATLEVSCDIISV
jgi:hypothetical protein